MIKKIINITARPINSLWKKVERKLARLSDIKSSKSMNSIEGLLVQPPYLLNQL